MTTPQLLLVIALSAGSPAQSEAAPPPPSRSLEQSRAAPTAPPRSAQDSQDIARFYPERALRLEIEGRAVVECVLQADGSLASCIVLEETPPDLGFGEATVRAATRVFRMNPTKPDGQSAAGAKVQIPVVWSLPD